MLTESTPARSIFAPTKKRTMQIPVLRCLNIFIIPFSAKNSEIRPIRANVLDEIARKLLSSSVSAWFPSRITPITAGTESMANMTSVDPINRKVRAKGVIANLPLTREWNLGSLLLTSTWNNFFAARISVFFSGSIVSSSSWLFIILNVM